MMATSNPGKLAELKEALRSMTMELHAAPRDFSCAEDGTTFYDNALQKAKAASKLYSIASLADDSGLSVTALNGFPGVHSARHFGNGEGINTVLQMLQSQPDRSAMLVCCLVLVSANGHIMWTHTAEVEGSIATEARGCGGFGYDPIFIPKGSSMTFAELPSSQKASMGHRGKALRELHKFFERCERMEQS